ncbi:hypothetical protein AB0F17_28600 [Nonomuraea sp. NPDC026600]|uniref:hypothetical protein n=1 Tax=Nonomuraea sp. NPDC026600 TaxID=3155363 RepID=UPI00341059A2
MSTVDDLIGHAAEAALSGLRRLPADLVLRRQVSDLILLAAELYPEVTTPQALMFALDQMHARAARLVAIAALPECPGRAEQEAMTPRQLEQAARHVAATAYGLGVQDGRRGADPRILAAAFDLSVDRAVQFVNEAATGR